MALTVDRSALWTIGPVCLVGGIASSLWNDSWIWMISFATIGAVLILGTAPDEPSDNPSEDPSGDVIEDE